MRLALIGAGSFIARHVALAAASRNIDTIPIAHQADLHEALRGADVVVNFALHPDFRSGPYRAEKDMDLLAARAAAERGVRFVMLSSRKVYPATVRWGAKESDTATGDETPYGQNKAKSEAAASAALSGNVTILRLSNVIGFEYEAGHPRRTFMGMVLWRLRSDGEIWFDMSPETRRDFLPVERCAAAILAAACSNSTGTYNVGCGSAMRCGEIANAVLKGFGKGGLVVTQNVIRDAFYLDISERNAHFTEATPPAEISQYCEMLGRRLRDA